MLYPHLDAEQALMSITIEVEEEEEEGKEEKKEEEKDEQ